MLDRPRDHCRTLQRPRRRRGPDRSRARLPRRAARAVRPPPPRFARRARPSARRGSTPASFPTSSTRPATSARRDWTVGAIPRDLLDRRVEITGPTNAKMLINALNSGAQAVHGRLRGRDLADLGRAGPGPGQPAQLLARPLDYTDPGQRQALCGRRRSRGADGPPARLAPARRPCDGERRGRSPARCSISASISGTTRGPRWRRAPAPISICPSSRAGTRRRCGATSSPSRKPSSGSSAGRSRRRC